MAFHVTYMGVAEASAADHRGAFTVIGFGLNIIGPASLPATLPLTILTLLDEDDPVVPDPEFVTARPIVTDPDGTVLLAGQQQVSLNSSFSDASVPSRVQIAMSAGLLLTHTGRYHVVVDYDVAGQSLHAESYFYVRTAAAPL